MFVLLGPADLSVAGGSHAWAQPFALLQSGLALPQHWSQCFSERGLFVLLLPLCLLPSGVLTSFLQCIAASQSLGNFHDWGMFQWIYVLLNEHSIWIVIWQYYLIIWNCCCGPCPFWIVWHCWFRKFLIDCYWPLLVTCASWSLILCLVFLRAPRKDGSFHFILFWLVGVDSGTCSS